MLISNSETCFVMSQIKIVKIMFFCCFVVDQDGAEPSSNSVAVSNLIRLSAFLDRTDLADRAKQILQAFNDRLNKIPISLPEMLCGLVMLKDSCKQVRVMKCLVNFVQN